MAEGRIPLDFMPVSVQVTLYDGLLHSSGFLVCINGNVLPKFGEELSLSLSCGL
jgi:hypothetical protein